MLELSERPNIGNLDDLVSRVERHGGRIIQYDRIWSLFVVSTYASRFEWVGPNHNRIVRGLPHSLFSILLGWWSHTGLFWTMRALIHNFFGGVDVTRELVPSAPPSDEDSTARRRLIQRVYLAWVAAMFLIV